jgi:branched-chain amino acid transport system ATP-binding protein
MDIVREYASRVIALYDGRIIADGEASAVFADGDVIKFITGAVGRSRSENRHAAD